MDDIRRSFEDSLLKNVRYNIRLVESTVMSDSPFSLRRVETTGWKFAWYAKDQTYNWDVEDFFIDSECIYIGPKHPGVKLITIKKNRQKLNINWEKKTISYKGEVDGFDTWGEE